MSFDILFYFCAVIEINFFVDFDNLKFFSENCQLNYCDNYYSLLYCLNSFVICFFLIFSVPIV